MFLQKKMSKWWIETYVRLIREVDWTLLWVYPLIGLRGLIGIKSKMVFLQKKMSKWWIETYIRLISEVD